MFIFNAENKPYIGFMLQVGLIANALKYLPSLVKSKFCLASLNSTISVSPGWELSSLRILCSSFWVIGVINGCKTKQFHNGIIIAGGKIWKYKAGKQRKYPPVKHRNASRFSAGGVCSYTHFIMQSHSFLADDSQLNFLICMRAFSISFLRRASSL